MIAIDDLMTYTRAASVDEGLVRSLERSAVAALEKTYGLHLGPVTDIVETRLWRTWPLELMAAPVEGVQLETWTGTGWEALDAGAYVLEGPRIWPAGSWSRPAPTRLRATYRGGYEPDNSDPDVWDAPEDVRQAVRMLTEHWYSNRGAVIVGSINAEMKIGLDFLMRDHRAVAV